MSTVKELNWIQRLLPIVEKWQPAVAVIAVSSWFGTAICMGRATPVWVGPLAISLGLLTTLLGTLIRHFFPPGADSELEQTICNSSPTDDWYINEEFSSPDHWVNINDSTAGSAHGVPQIIAVYKKDPSIIFWVETKAHAGQGFKEPWLDKLFPDNEHNSLHLVSIRKNGSELITVKVLSVDGARAWLPLPKNPTASPLVADFLALAVAQILNRSDEYRTDFYLRRAGFDELVISKFTNLT